MSGLELAASVLTVVQVVFMLFEQFQNAIKYAKEVISINDTISDLLAKLRDLHRLTKTVASTYTQAESIVTRNSESLHQIRTALGLASLESTTFGKKFKTKQEMDRLKGNIQALKDNIQWDIGFLHSGLACLSVDLHVTRRASESVEVPESIQASIRLQDSNEDTVSPLSPTFTTLSNADTVWSRTRLATTRILDISILHPAALRIFRIFASAFEVIRSQRQRCVGN
jgi:DNA mismatch repair ATPase MutS